MSREVELGCESCYSTAVQRTLSLRLCPAQQLKQQLRSTLVPAQWRGHRLNTSIVWRLPRPPRSLGRCARYARSNLHSLAPPPPPPPRSPSLIRILASVNVKKIFTVHIQVYIQVHIGIYRYTQVNIGPWNNRRRRSVAGRPSKRSDVDVTAEAIKRSNVDREDAEGNVVHWRLEEKRNLADSEAKAAFSMPAVRTLGDRRNGGVRPTAHVPQYLPLFPTTRTVRHCRRTLHADCLQMQTQGEQLHQTHPRLSGTVASLPMSAFWKALWQWPGTTMRDCVPVYRHLSHLSVRTPVTCLTVCKDIKDQSHLSVRISKLSLTYL